MEDLRDALSGLFIVDDPNGARVPLLDVDIEAKVLDMNVAVRLRQHYANPTDHTLAVMYRFPLDCKAGVYDFQATINGKTVRGAVKEKAEAQRVFDEAVTAGKTAALVSRHAQQKETFQCDIGNLPPRSDCIVELCYIAELRLHNLTLELHLPSFLAPRYSPEETTWEGAVTSGIDSRVPDPVPPASTLAIRVHIRTASKLATIDCKTHRHKVTRLSPDEAVVELSEKKATLDTNFVVTVTQEKQSDPRGSVCDGLAGSGVDKVVQLTFSPPEVELTELTEMPLEVIFLVDRSGSMDGDRIKAVVEAMRICLRSLPTRARFNIVAFGTHKEVLFTTHNDGDNKGQKDNMVVSVPYSEETLAVASAHIESWLLPPSLGGTEILEPMRAVLSSTVIPTHPRQVFLLTDGQVSNPTEVVAVVGQYSHAARVHVVGIGNGVDRSLVESIARAGRGARVFLSDAEAVGPKITRVFVEGTQPCLYNMEIVDCGPSWRLVSQTCSGPVYGRGVGFLYGFLVRKAEKKEDDAEEKDLGCVVRALTNAPGVVGGALEFKLRASVVAEKEFRHLLQLQGANSLIKELEHKEDLISGVPWTAFHPSHMHPMLRDKTHAHIEVVCNGCGAAAKPIPGRYRCLEKTCTWNLCESCWGGISFPEQERVDALRKEGVAVSVLHNLISRWTSSVAIYQGDDASESVVPLGASSWGSSSPEMYADMPPMMAMAASAYPACAPAGLKCKSAMSRSFAPASLKCKSLKKTVEESGGADGMDEEEEEEEAEEDQEEGVDDDDDDNGGGVTEEKKKKKVVDPLAWESLHWVDELLNMQKADGSWQLNEKFIRLTDLAPRAALNAKLFSLLLGPVTTLAEFVESIKTKSSSETPIKPDPSVVATSIALFLLREYAASRRSEFLMIESKGNKWLNKKPSAALSSAVTV